MLSLLNRYLPKSILNRFKEPFKYFIRRQNKYIEAQLSLLQLQGLLPAVPSEELQLRVAGDSYGDFFLHGDSFINDMSVALQKEGKSFDSFENILDFGTGCGRVLIPLSYRISPHKLYGTDIDQEAIKWFSSSYTQFGGIDYNPTIPPMKYSDNMFDLIFSISVFTHLPEDMQFAWLGELRRITKPNGYLLLSFHGEYVINTMGKNIVTKIQENGFYYELSTNGGTDGLPQFYQEAFHAIDYIKKEWGQYFEVLSIIPKGIGNNQDLAILRKR